MAKEQTEKCRYPSKYSNSYVTQSQYLVETLLENIAKQDHKVLPFKFWNLSEWNTLYRRHITEVNKLIKKFSFESILKTLQDPYIQRSCKSFCFPPFKKLLQKNQTQTQTQKQTQQTASNCEYHIEDNIITSDASNRPTNSPLSKLRSI